MGKKIDIAMIAGLTEVTKSQKTKINTEVNRDVKTKVSATISLQAMQIIRNVCYTEVINGGDKRYLSEALEKIIITYGESYKLEQAPTLFMNKKERKTNSR